MDDRRHAQQDAETRQARIVQIYQGAADEIYTTTPSQAPPPAYNEVVLSNVQPPPAAYIDEKPALSAERRQLHSAFSSPRTSVISVPSTRLTDITSAHTGGTSITLVNRQPESQRSSLVFDSAPPSYYDGRSERSTSPHSQRVSDEVLRHPVMSAGWLETLRRSVERDFAQDMPGAPTER